MIKDIHSSTGFFSRDESGLFPRTLTSIYLPNVSHPDINQFFKGGFLVV